MSRFNQLMLGDPARDRISGFTGVIIARSEWLTGCSQVLLQPFSEDPSAFPEPQWFDAPRCDRMSGARVEMMPQTAIGGPDRKTPKSPRG